MVGVRKLVFVFLAVLFLSFFYVQESVADLIVSTADTPLVNIVFKGINHQRMVCQFEYNRKTIEVGNRTKAIEGFVRIEVTAINKTNTITQCFATISYNPIETKIVERNDGSLSHFMYVKKVLKPAIPMRPGEIVQVDVNSIQPILGVVGVPVTSASATFAQESSKESSSPLHEEIVPPAQSVVVIQKQPQGFWQWLASIFKRRSP